MPNTRMAYLYRDGSNYKYPGVVVVRGLLTFNDLKPYLDEEAGDGSGFCPADVGLPHPAGGEAEGFPSEDDHCWCELNEDDFRLTNETGDITAEELVARFKKAHEAGWPAQTTFGIKSEEEEQSDNNIEIVVKGGVVIDVRGLPEGWVYTLIDHDVSEH